MILSADNPHMSCNKNFFLQTLPHCTVTLILTYKGQRECIFNVLGFPDNVQFKAVTSCSTHRIDQQETDG